MKKAALIAAFLLSFIALAALCVRFTWLAPVGHAEKALSVEVKDNLLLFIDEYVLAPILEKTASKKEPVPVYRSKEAAFGGVGVLAVIYAGAFAGWRLGKRNTKRRREEKNRTTREMAIKAEENHSLRKDLEGAETAEKEQARIAGKKDAMNLALKKGLVRLGKREAELSLEKERAIKEYRVLAAKYENASVLAKKKDARLEKLKSDLDKKDRILEKLNAEVEGKNADLKKMKSVVKKKDAAISKLEKVMAKQEETRRQEKIEYTPPRKITFADAAADGKRFTILYVGREPFKACKDPEVKPVAVKTLEEAKELIEKRPFDGMVAPGDILEKAKPEPLNFEKPVIVAASAKETRQLAGKFFPYSLIRFIGPSIYSHRKVVFKTFLEMAPVEMATIFRKGAERLISADTSVVKTAAKLREIAGVTPVILFTGPTGCGKELFATLAHESRTLSKKDRLVVVNCKAVTETLFESLFFGHEKGAFTGANKNNPGYFMAAGGGTIFFDEVGELSMECQVKLLRPLDGYEFIPVGGYNPLISKANIIMATHRNPRDKSRSRDDFFYRIGAVDFPIPSLKERSPVDLHLISEYFVMKYNVIYGKNCRLSEAMIENMQDITFPGNVRELSGLLRRTVMDAGEKVLLPKIVLPEHHPDYKGEIIDLPELIKSFTTKHITDALARAGGNQSRAARNLSLRRSTLVDKMRQCNIDLDKYTKRGKAKSASVISLVDGDMRLRPAGPPGEKIKEVPR